MQTRTEKLNIEELWEQYLIRYANPHAPTTFGSTTITYDNNGNATEVSTSTYSYDYQNRLTQSVANNATSSYTYDHTTARVSQTTIASSTPTTTTTYISKFYSLTSTPITSTTTNATSTAYVYMGDTLVSTIDQPLINGTATGTAIISYIHPNHLQSTNIVTDQNKNIIQSLDYLPYGAPRINTKTTSIDSARKYIGQFADQSGLDYLNARYYDATRGQFLSQDPVFWNTKQNLQDPQSLNSYSYGNGNPISRSDPMGLWAIGVGLGGGGNTPGLYADASSFWVITASTHPFNVELGVVTSGGSGGITAVLGGSGSVRVMTSKNARGLQDFQGWGVTGGMSGKLGVDLGFDYSTSRVNDPNNKNGRVVDSETLSVGVGALATPYVVPVEIHGGGSYSQVSNVTNLTPYINSASNSIKSGVQSSYAYIKTQVSYIQQKINVLRQQIDQYSQSSSNAKSNNSK